MSDCCDNKAPPKGNKKLQCLDCDEMQNAVPYQTLIHHLKNPKQISLPEDSAYYFCKNPNCSTVYFCADDLKYSMDDVRWPIGQKSSDDNRQICYCFDVTFDQVVDEFAATGRSETKEFVMAQTKAKNCACEVRNPSGRCCLVDFPKG
jgi:hypothetical protein